MEGGKEADKRHNRTGEEEADSRVGREWKGGWDPGLVMDLSPVSPGIAEKT